MTLPTFERRMIRKVNPWLLKPRPGREREIAGVMIHCTRGGRSAGDDGVGTENWAASSGNGSAAKGWGSSWEGLIYESGLQVQTNDWDNSYASWCAGYGGSGTWPAGFYYIMLEVSQGLPTDPFTEAEFHSAAQWTAEASIKYDFPLIKIPFLNQKGTPPRGICSHEDSANGRKLGKSDPGPMWNWPRFLNLCRQYQAELLGEDDMTEAEVRAIVESILAEKGLDDIDDRLREVSIVRERLRNLASDPDATRVEKAYAALKAANFDF